MYPFFGRKIDPKNLTQGAAMLPIGPLMVEHRLIERMVKLIRDRLSRAKDEGKVDPGFVDAVVDFFRIYADRTHHGKEEDILFEDLSDRDLSEKDAQMMEKLLEDHRKGRRIVSGLAEANQAYRDGDENALEKIQDRFEQLLGLYPQHIQKEDKVFFPASMEYMDSPEKDSMLEKMWEFDRNMIHEKYTQVVERYQANKA
jgi:hemerythrin-like domain-containing protein